jgi:hypothetical protein
VAFTEEEKTEIRMYLGWDARWAQIDTALERGIFAIGGGGFPAEEAMARTRLAKLRDIDSKIEGADSRLKASVVGSITLNAAELQKLRSRGKQEARRLARIFGVKPKSDAFGTGGGGDGGNYQRHG